MTTPLTEPTKVSFAGDAQTETNLPLVLIDPDTKATAQLAALTAIATPEIIGKRDSLILLAKTIETVTTDEEAKEASNIAGSLKGIRNAIEKARVAVKERVLIIARAIDGTAKATSDPAETEMKRLEGLGARYLQEKERQRQIEIRRQQEEQARLQREADKKAKEAADEAERLRKEAEAAQAAGNADKALDLELAAEEAQEKVAEIEVPQPVAPIPAEVKLTGSAVSYDYEIQVTDIALLYQNKPECVELSPKMQIIKGIVKSAAQQAGGKSFTIPGLFITPKVKLTSKAQ